MKTAPRLELFEVSQSFQDERRRQALLYEFPPTATHERDDRNRDYSDAFSTYAR